MPGSLWHLFFAAQNLIWRMAFLKKRFVLPLKRCKICVLCHLPCIFLKKYLLIYIYIYIYIRGLKRAIVRFSSLFGLPCNENQ